MSEDALPLQEYEEACNLPGLLERVRMLERDCIEYEKAFVGLGEILNGMTAMLNVLISRIGQLETITEQRTADS